MHDQRSFILLRYSSSTIHQTQTKGSTIICTYAKHQTPSIRAYLQPIELHPAEVLVIQHTYHSQHTRLGSSAPKQSNRPPDSPLLSPSAHQASSCTCHPAHTNHSSSQWCKPTPSWPNHLLPAACSATSHNHARVIAPTRSAALKAMCTALLLRAIPQARLCQNGTAHSQRLCRKRRLQDNATKCGRLCLAGYIELKW
jgi:hypothetical protein